MAFVFCKLIKASLTKLDNHSCAFRFKNIYEIEKQNNLANWLPILNLIYHFFQIKKNKQQFKTCDIFSTLIYSKHLKNRY